MSQYDQFGNPITNKITPTTKTMMNAMAQGLTLQSTPPTAASPAGTAGYCPTTGAMMVSTGSGVVQLTSPTISVGSAASYTEPYLVSSDGEVTFSAKGKTLKVSEMVDFMEVMKERMLVLMPDFEKHEKYPALKEAYEQYKLIEKMVTGDHGDMP